MFFVVYSLLPFACVFTVTICSQAQPWFTWVPGDEADELVGVDGCVLGTKKVVASATRGKYQRYHSQITLKGRVGTGFS